MRSITSSASRTAVVVLTLLSAAAPAAARPVVVELFTSQSCSSCPPAEALLGQLAAEGGEVLPLAYHVTYWNHLDWRDTYSLPAATQRQSDYAQRMGEGSYTPEAVIDGRVGLVGSREGAVRAAIAAARNAAVEAVPVSLSGRDRLTGRRGEGRGTGTVTLVGFDPRHETSVPRGENAGRTLTQFNVVRSVAAIGHWTGAAQELTVPWPAGKAAAILVQGADGRILGAASWKGGGA